MDLSQRRRGWILRGLKISLLLFVHKKVLWIVVSHSFYGASMACLLGTNDYNFMYVLGLGNGQYYFLCGSIL